MIYKHKQIHTNDSHLISSSLHLSLLFIQCVDMTTMNVDSVECDT